MGNYVTSPTARNSLLSTIWTTATTAYYATTSKVFGWPRPDVQPTIMVVGLDNAGKTTLFRYLSFDPDRHRPIMQDGVGGGGGVPSEAPTIGFNMDKCRVEGVDIVLWD